MVILINSHSAERLTSGRVTERQNVLHAVEAIRSDVTVCIGDVMILTSRADPTDREARGRRRQKFFPTTTSRTTGRPIGCVAADEA